MNSFIDFTGSEGCTSTMFGVMPIRVTGAISRNWSYGIFANSDTAIALEAILHWIKACPSGGDFATNAVPSTPATPTRLSTMTCWPHRRVKRSAIRRATMSGEVPGPNGTT